MECFFVVVVVSFLPYQRALDVNCEFIDMIFVKQARFLKLKSSKLGQLQT